MRGGALAAVVLAAACASVETDPERIVVAWLDDRPQSLASWQRYLAANLLDAVPGASEAAADARVQSRLFDAFVDERLLLAEAERRGIEATDAEVEVWLGFGGGLDEEPVTSERWERARDRVMIQKLEEDVAAALPAASDATDAAISGAPAATAAPGRVVRLSSLRFEDPVLAGQVAADIARARSTFDEAIEAHGSAEDGVPVDMAWESLWEEHRAALDGLRAGQVTGPVVVAGTVYLFRVEAWLDAAAVGAARDERARRGVERTRRQAAFAALLEELREKGRIRVNLAALPFTYVADDRVS